MIYVNIALIFIFEIISICLLATIRRGTIESECQYHNLLKTTDVDYLTNPIGTAVNIDQGCGNYWRSSILTYAIGILITLLIMVSFYSASAATQHSTQTENITLGTVRYNNSFIPQAFATAGVDGRV